MSKPSPTPSAPSWFPRLILQPVNQRVTWQYFGASAGILGIGAANARFSWVEDLWDLVLELNADSSVSDTIELLHGLSLLSAGGAMVLLILVSLRLPDAQFTLHFATGLLFAALFTLFVAWFALPPEFPRVVKVILLVLAALFLSLVTLNSFSRYSDIGYYWRSKAYGDVVLASFLVLVVLSLPAFSLWSLAQEV